MLSPLLRGWVMNAACRETEMLGISSHRGIRKDSRPLCLSPCSLISLWGGLVDPRVRATFSPAQPRARRDALLSQASTVSSCAFCEQKGHLTASFPSFGGRRCASTEDH